MNTTILTRDGMRVIGTSAVVLAATLAALLAVFILAKPSEAADPILTVEPSEVGFGEVQVNTTDMSPLFLKHVSLPPTPLSMSQSRSLALSRSLPLFPNSLSLRPDLSITLSLPAPARVMSLPPRGLTLSLPAMAQMTSLPGVPVRASPRLVPMTVQPWALASGLTWSMPVPFTSTPCTVLPVSSTSAMESPMEPSTSLSKTTSALLVSPVPAVARS